MDKLMSKIGFLLFLLGAGGMDSQNQIVPAAMVLLGLAILAISAFVERRENRYEYTDRSICNLCIRKR